MGASKRNSTEGQEWSRLNELCDELVALGNQPLEASRLLVYLSQLFSSVEHYLVLKGLTCRADGTWTESHPGYSILQQLAESIEACKESGLQLDQRLLCFIQDVLLPQLHKNWEAAV